MGIPVILFAFRNDVTRYSALDGILPVYTFDDLENNTVNWFPNAPDIEDLKHYMISNLDLTIKEQLGETVNLDILQNLRDKIENYKIIN